MIAFGFPFKIDLYKSFIDHAQHSYSNRYKWTIFHHGWRSLCSQIEYRARIRPGTLVLT